MTPSRREYEHGGSQAFRTILRIKPNNNCKTVMTTLNSIKCEPNAELIELQFWKVKNKMTFYSRKLGEGTQIRETFIHVLSEMRTYNLES